MDNFHILLTDVLGAYLQAWNFKSIQDMIVKDHVSEDDMIALLKHHGPHEADEYIADEVSGLCSEIITLVYRKKWYRLVGFIYGMGFGAETIDPLCGSRDPLAFAAAERNPALAAEIIKGLKMFDYLSFDGERKCPAGYRTLPEELVVIDCVEVVSLCLENGMSANGFGFCGERLLDLARSEEMRQLLLRHGATNATSQERNLVRACNELRRECLKRATVNAFFSEKPLLKLSYFNGNTTNSREQKYNIFMEAALACNAELLEELHPLVESDLEEKDCKEVILRVLGQNCTLPCSRVLDYRPIDVALSLEALRKAGFRYGISSDLAADYPFIEMIRCACWTFSFLDLTPINIQLRVFTALWEIGGSPNGDIVIQALQKLAEEHPTTAMDMFISHVKSAIEEE